LSRDQTYGTLILLVSIVVFVLYAWLLYIYPLVILQITAFLAVAAVLVISGWIGWTMATTPPPAPLDIGPAIPETPTSTTNEKKE